MTTSKALLAFSLLTSPIAAFAQTPAPAPPSPQVQTHLDAARKLAGSDLPLLCGGPEKPDTDPTDYTTPEPPTRAFDNLYYVGPKYVSGWVLKTSAGLILIDAPFNGDLGKNVLVPSMKALGLDPAQIKYVVVTHGHTDHYGGSQYFKDTYGAKIIMSQKDSAGRVRNPQGAPLSGPMPVPDIFATDGYKLTLGDTTLTLYATPGHTPGTYSAVFPVYDHGTRHMAALWGGVGYPERAVMQDAYRDSLAHFKQATDAAHVDVALTNHIRYDGEDAKLAAIRAGAKPNPLILGEDGYRRLMAERGECLDVFIAK